MKNDVLSAASLFRSFSAPFRLLNASGISLFPEDGERLAVNGRICSASVSVNGFLLTAIPGRDDYLLALPESVPGAPDLLLAVSRLLADSLPKTEPICSPQDIFRCLFLDKPEEGLLLEKASEFGLEEFSSRRVTVFSSDYPFPDGFPSLLDKRSDGLSVPLTETACAYVQTVSGTASFPERMDAVRSLAKTYTEETGIRVYCGIGEIKSSILTLKDSFEEAREAIRCGRVFFPEESVFAYRRILPESLALGVSKDSREKMSALLDDPGLRTVLAGELKETVQACFRYHLNLSETARGLFIHRNTLLYRLDKIRTLTGFDLRRFDDAAALKTLMNLTADLVP